MSYMSPSVLEELRKVSGNEVAILVLNITHRSVLTADLRCLSGLPFPMAFSFARNVQVYIVSWLYVELLLIYL